MITTESRVASIVETVMRRSRGRWKRRDVLDLASDHIKPFVGAPVQQFVEVLVAKEVTDELRRIEALSRAT